MQLWSLLEPFELIGPFKIPLHHIQEAIVIPGRTSRILHDQGTRVSQARAHHGAQRPHTRRLLHRRIGARGDLEVRRQIHHWEIHGAQRK